MVLWIRSSLHDGNPQRFHVQDWLEIFDWSVENPNHSLITVVLDIKDDLTDNLSFRKEMAAFNAVVVDQFSYKLLKASEWNSQEYVSDVQGKFQVILSGDGDTRKAYKRDKGENPAVAVNNSGQVIFVHDSGQDFVVLDRSKYKIMVLWNGNAYGRYGTGQLPAIALNNDGWFVEVHQSENHNTLWSQCWIYRF